MWANLIQLNLLSLASLVDAINPVADIPKAVEQVSMRLNRLFDRLRANGDKKGILGGFPLIGVWGCPPVIHTRAGGWVEMASVLQAGITVNELVATNHVGKWVLFDCG